MSHKKNQPNFKIFFGRHEKANYREQLIPMYEDNPLIEALPEIMSTEDFFNLASRYPEYDERQRELPSELRLHLIMTAAHCFQVLTWHLDLERKISRLFRLGYQSRNPIERGYWKKVDTRVGEVAIGSQSAGRSQFRNLMLGFFILGISGIGKTSIMERILQLYAQVILHTEYHGKPFSWIQLLWLKLDCPFDGSIKGLCLNFFDAIDDLLGTNYFYTYARNGRATVDQMIPAMSRLAFIHSIGGLFIDEIQNLNEAKSGGANKMLNFFTQLVNTVGMPVILIGTPKAKKFLSSEFRQVRRGAGQGDFVINPMEQDEEWDLFLEAIWQYQYTKKPSRLTRELNDVIYHESAGISDIAVKLYILAQGRAIETGQEEVTPEIIKSVAKDSLVMAQPMLKALRERDWAKLELFDDIKPLENVEQHIESSLEEIHKREKAENLRRLKRETEKSKLASSDAVLSPKARKKHEKRRKFVPPAGSLIGIVDAGLRHDIAAYDALKMAGHIRECEEYIGAAM